MKIPRLARVALRTFAVGGIALGAAHASDESASANCVICSYSGTTAGCQTRPTSQGGGEGCNVSVDPSGHFSCSIYGSCHSG